MAFQIHALLLLASLPAAALQGERPKQVTPGDTATTRPANPSAQTYVALDDLLKADVMIQGDAARAPADKEKKGDTDRTKGKIKEIVVARDGQIPWAVVSSGGLLGLGDKQVLVPFSSLTYSTVDNKPVFHWKMSEAELKAMPDFDTGKAEKDLDAAINRVQGATGASSKQGADDMSDKTGAMATAAGPRYVFSSRLKGAKVVATDKDFGKVDNAAIDVRKSHLDYLVLSHGGALGMGNTMAVVPMQAVAWVMPADARGEDQWVLKINKTVEQLKTAPEYKKPDNGFVTQDQLKQSDVFFGTTGTRFD